MSDLNPRNDILLEVGTNEVEMPKLDGLSLCKKTPQLEGYATKPIIFFSSMIDDAMKNKCTAVGGEAAFSKPEIHLIVDSIEEFIS